MSREANLATITLLAGADLSAAQYAFVKVNSSEQVILCSAAGENAIGILQNKPTQGQAATVAFGGKSKVKLNATLASGSLVETDATGLAKAAVVESISGAAATGGYVMGTILKGGVAGDIGSMIIDKMGAVPTTAA